MSHRTTIGEHSVFFNRRSEFVYRTLCDLDCYAIKKTKVRKVFAKHQELAAQLKRIALYRYRKNIRKPL